VAAACTDQVDGDWHALLQQQQELFCMISLTLPLVVNQLAAVSEFVFRKKMWLDLLHVTCATINMQLFARPLLCVCRRLGTSGMQISMVLLLLMFLSPPLAGARPMYGIDAIEGMNGNMDVCMVTGMLLLLLLFLLLLLLQCGGPCQHST
jgi:hypothetical protein